MRKITSFYYLNYPDNSPNDPLDAYSETYVEIGDERSELNDFEETFSVHVYTVRSLDNLVTKDGYAALKSAIIVDRFEDQTIENVLNKILENIEDYGTKVGS
jgi:hypothetical protein